MALAVAESEKEKIFNRYIEIFCQQKWLFYAFCMQNRNLQQYIPQTIIATAPTFTGANFGSMKEFLLKPPSLSKGRGIIKMRSSDLDISQRLHKYVVEYASPNHIIQLFYKNIFVTQKIVRIQSVVCMQLQQ